MKYSFTWLIPCAIASLGRLHDPVVREVLVDDLPQPLGARLRRERDGPLAARRHAAPASAGVMASTRSDDGLKVPPASAIVQVSGSSPL